MADTDIVQVIAEARIDARSLSEFVFKPAGFMVQRRLAPPINTLEYYLNLFNKTATDGAAMINQAIINSGFIVVDSFELGATLTQRNQALRHAVDGNLYRWAGNLPKTVFANTTPASSGGFGSNAWVEVSDAAIRQELAVEYGVSNAANSIVTVDNVAELEALPEGARREDLRYLVKGYHAGSTVGGGLFEYAPTSPFPDDGGRRIGDFVRVETTYDTPFTFANYGYDFENHSISGQTIAQKIFDTALTVPESEHIVIEISDGVIFVDETATLNRANLTLRGQGTCYVSAPSVIGRFIEILLPEDRNKNLIVEDLRIIGLFDGTLTDMFQKRGESEYGRRLYIRGGEGVQVRNIYAKRIAIPVDVRNSENVYIHNVTLVEGNCGVSVITCKHVNISSLTGINYTGAVLDFSDVQYGAVTNVVGYISEEGRGFSEECVEVGSCKDLVISNVYSYGPTTNMIRIKFEDVEQPFSNLRLSNLICRDAITGITLQSAENNTGELTENIHISGVNMVTDGSCITKTGTLHIYNVSISDFHLVSRGRSALALQQMSDVSVYNGYAFCDTMSVSRASIRFGENSAIDGIVGNRIRMSNVRIGSKNTEKEVISVIGSEDVSMNDVTITEGHKDGIVFTECRDVRLHNMNFNNLKKGNAIFATFTSDELGSEVDAAYSIKSCTFRDYGMENNTKAAVYFRTEGVEVKGIVFTDNNITISPELSTDYAKRLAVLATETGGSFGTGSIIARNTVTGFSTLFTGSLGRILLKDNDVLDGNYTEPDV